MANIFEQQIGNTLHHIYLIEGEKVETEKELLDFLSKRGVNIENNANIMIEHYESLNIAKAHLLKSYQSEKSSNGENKYFIITATGINHEAENALLKIFEEPTEGTYFFLILPKVDILPATLRSRAHTIHTHIFAEDTFVHNFIKQSIADRLASISEIIKKHKDDETSGPLRDHAVNILDNIEKVLHKGGNITKQDVFKYEELIKARHNLALPGSAVKMILEHIALVI